MSALRKFLRLSNEEKRIALFCIAAFACYPILVRLVGTGWVSQSLELPSTTNPTPQRNVERLAHLVEHLARKFRPRPTCLVRSLVLRALLRSRGIEPQLRIGVRINGIQLEAHCWLECDGLPINDASSVQHDFIPLARVPETR